MIMLARVVDYLRSNDVPFRLESYPSPEPMPPVAHAIHTAGVLPVDTRVLLINGRPAIACLAHGDEINLAGLRNSLSAELVEEGGLDDLPWFLEQADTPLPPLGRLFGVPLFVDERVAAAPLLCFGAFGAMDFLEMSFDDLARIEQPRVAPVGLAGELPPAELH